MPWYIFLRTRKSKKEAATQEVVKDESKKEGKYAKAFLRLVFDKIITEADKVSISGVTDRTLRSIRAKRRELADVEGGTITKQLTELPKINLK